MESVEKEKRGEKSVGDESVGVLFASQYKEIDGLEFSSPVVCS